VSSIASRSRELHKRSNSQAEQLPPATGIGKDLFMVEKVFTQANLADCLQIKLSDHSLNDSERTKVDEDLQKALETFNDTCLKVFASDRSNE
jgi:hypothetical protein